MLPKFQRNLRRKHFRKQPNPYKSPDKSGDDMSWRIIIYEIYEKNPTHLLKSNSTLDYNVDSIKEISQLPINHNELNLKNP
ncbi:homeodomain-like protein [Rhizophagus clarus]|uniref:Homeodomain-like protein n=1 Tax=Rhizophagus clarus TaxID=94130 RepID=A0A8H3QJQ1_9GLOM|nr:homeodomain-like protein [Rhizophagus clarus]